MKEFLLAIVEWVSFGIGLVGISVILLGALRGIWEYFAECATKRYPHIRATLGSHLILGLDFLVGKDVIDTILLDHGSEFWMDLAGLFSVVTIRIVLTYFLTQELKEIDAEELAGKK